MKSIAHCSVSLPWSLLYFACRPSSVEGSPTPLPKFASYLAHARLTLFACRGVSLCWCVWVTSAYRVCAQCGHACGGQDLQTAIYRPSFLDLKTHFFYITERGVLSRSLRRQCLLQSHPGARAPTSSLSCASRAGLSRAASAGWRRAGRVQG